jgi:lysophospholipase L1-like esterase
MLGTRPFPNVIGSRRRSGSPGLTIANEFEARVITAGGTLTADTKTAIQVLADTGITDGWWESVLEIHPFVGSNLAASLVKLKNASGLPDTLTNSGMVSGDYSQSAGMGPTSVTTKYLSTGLVFSDFSLTKTNTFVSTSLVTQGPAANGYTMGTEDETNGAGYWADVNNRANGFVTTGSGGYSTHTLPLSLVTNHGGSNVQIGYHNGAQVLNSTQAVVADTLALTSEFRYFRVKRFNTTYYGGGKIGLTIIGPSLSDAHCWSIAKATEAFETAVGRSGYTTPVAALIGDSVSSGQASSAMSNSFANLVQAELGGRLLNCGRPTMSLNVTGATATSGYLARATHAALPTSTLILALGTNDITADGNANGTSATIAALKANLITMITDYQAAGKTVIVCGPQYRKPASASATKCAAYNTAFSEAAATMSCTFVDVDAAIRSQGTPADFMQDDLHPNTAGHALIAAAIIAAL